MIAEGLAAISLVKASVDFIKSNIETAQDISQLASGIDGLFRGHDEVQKSRNKKASGTGIGDQFGIKTVAQEMIDAKLAEEKMNEMRNLIDMRFGHGTWKSIVDERARRIQEAKEVADQERRERIRKHKESMEAFRTGAIAVLVITVMLGALVGTIYFAS